MSENSNRKTTGQYPLHAGSEAEQYSFYRVPAVMFSDPELDDYGEPVRYTARKGKFKPKSIEILKSTLRAELENNRQIYASITTILRDTILLDKIDREQARQSRVYGGYSLYKENMLHGKEGVYARLGNAILRELQQYDRAVTERDVSRSARVLRAPGSTAHHSIAPVHNRRQLQSGFLSLEHLLKVNYEKEINQREAERLQAEIARRGDRGFEI